MKHHVPPMIILLLVISSLLTACSPSLTKDEVITKAVSLIDNREYSASEVILKEYLSKDTSDVDVREMLGRALTSSGKYESAISQFERIGSGKLSEKGFADYIQALYFTEQNSLLISTFQNRNEQQTPSSISNESYLYAIIELRENSGESEALELLAQQADTSNLSKRNPLLHQIIKSSLDFYRSGDVEAFKKALTDIPSVAPNANNDYLYLSIAGNFYFAELEFEKAAQTLKLFNDLKPAYTETKLMLAQALFHGGDMDDATEYLSSLLAKYPDQPILNQLRAFIYADEGDLENAKIHIENAIDRGFTTRQNFLLGGLLNFRLENYEQAINYLEKGVTSSSQTDQYSLMLSYSKARVSDSENAEKIVGNKTIQDLGDIAEIRSLVKGFSDIGNQQGLTKIVQTLNTSKNALPHVKMEAAILKAELLKTPESLEDMINSSLDVMDNSSSQVRQRNKAKLILLSGLIAKNEFAEAQKITDKWLADEPENALNRLLKAELLIDINRHEEALDYISSLDSIDQSHAIQRLLTSIHFHLNNLDLAEQSALNALKLNSASLKAVKDYAIVKLKQQDKDYTPFLALYPEADSQEGQAILTSMFYAMVDNYEAAIQSLTSLNIDGEPSMLYHYTLTETYLAAFEKEKALNASKKLAGLELVPVGSVSLLTDSLNKVGNQEGLLVFLNKQAKNYPLNTQVQHMLSLAYLKQNDIENASKALTNIPGRLMTESMQLTHAELVFRSGKVEDAERMYQLVFNKYDSELSLIRLANFYLQTSRQEKAVSFLENYIAKNDKALSPILMLASHVERKKAIELYQKAINISPQNVFALNNLAWALHQDGSNKKALPYAELAVSLAPDHINAQSTLQSIQASL
jgi:tetratricopeptide (TPR) repeat protein